MRECLVLSPGRILLFLISNILTTNNVQLLINLPMEKII